MIRSIFISLLALLPGLHAMAQADTVKPLILSSVSMINDMARNIGGENFRYTSIVPIGSDPHLYEPIPADVKKCTDAALILKNGLTLEGWIGRLIDNSGTVATVEVVSEGVVPISSLQYANSHDPHAWMTAANGLIYVQNIRDAMIQLMPSREDEFRENYRRYKERLEELDQYISRRIAEIPQDKRILITSHDAFQYYGRRYDIRLEAILGTSTDADVQTSDIMRLNQVISGTKVPAVFIESTINPRLISQLATDNGIAVGGKLFSDSLGETGGSADSYLKMLRHNTDTIFEGLSQDRDSSHEEEHPDYGWLWAILFAPVALALVIFLYRMIQT